MSLKRPLSLALAALAVAGSTVAFAAPADAAGYTTAGAIGTLYRSQAAVLGIPTSAEHTGNRDRVQSFKNGLIFWSSSTGAHSLRGGVLSAFNAQGGDRGKLGLPISEEIKVTGGVYQTFTNGTVFYSPGGGTRAVTGAIRSLYLQTGASGGTLGFPTSGQTTTMWGSQTVLSQTFQRGIITYNGTKSDLNPDAAHAHAVSGNIYKKFAAAGGLNSVGWALNSPVQAKTAVAQGFTNGTIVADPGLGTHLVLRPYYTKWIANGGATGKLGMPTSDEKRPGEMWPMYTDFQGGRIWCSPTGNVQIQWGTNLPTPVA